MKTQKAVQFIPTDAAAIAACQAFYNRTSAWAERFSNAKEALKGVLKANVKVKPLGILSRDSLQMSTFGLIFESNPGPGFMLAPGSVSESVKRQGLRGEAYFPDVATPVGKAVMNSLSAISALASDRPLMKNLPGVKPAVIDGNSMVLSVARMAKGKVVAWASPLAVGPQAMLEKSSLSDAREPDPFINHVADVAAKRTGAGLPTPMDGMRKPGPFRN